MVGRMCTNPWIAALTLVIGLGFMACSDEGSSEPGGQAGTGMQDGGGSGSAGASGGAGTAGSSGASQDGGADAAISFPVTPVELVAGEFTGAEGIAFNGEGRLFAVADKALWELSVDGSTRKVVDLVNPVGLASRGASDILVAEFGAKTFIRDGVNNDGSVLSVTPSGTVTTVATGIGDPNFIHVRKDGSMLVSDDFTDIIYSVAPGGAVSIFLQGIQSPNGMVESLNGANLFVAQTFATVDPLTFDDRLWRVPLKSGAPGTPVELAKLGGGGANDGVTMDLFNRVYVAENVGGNIWRVDASTGAAELIAQNMKTVASLAFGEGQFNETSIYATQLIGGTIWEIPVGVRGAPMNR